VFDLCLSNKQRDGISPFDASHERAVEEVDGLTPRHEFSLVDWSDAVSRKKGRIADVSKKRSIKAK
jgi:hypothetical protein